MSSHIVLRMFWGDFRGWVPHTHTHTQLCLTPPRSADFDCKHSNRDAYLVTSLICRCVAGLIPAGLSGYELRASLHICSASAALTCRSGLRTPPAAPVRTNPTDNKDEGLIPKGTGDTQYLRGRTQKFGNHQRIFSCLFHLAHN